MFERLKKVFHSVYKIERQIKGEKIHEILNEKERDSNGGVPDDVCGIKNLKLTLKNIGRQRIFSREPKRR